MHRDCDDCGARAVRKVYVDHRFTYGNGDSAVELTTMVPVWRCSTCDSMYMNHEGEAARHEAVCRFLKVLTPQEIRAIRGSRPRNAIQAATGIAEASLKRWESGEQIQTLAMDTLLRFLGNPVAASQLPIINADRDRVIAKATPSFRTALPPEVEERAKHFELRKIG
jgi:transposase-like protein